MRTESFGYIESIDADDDDTVEEVPVLHAMALLKQVINTYSHILIFWNQAIILSSVISCSVFASYFHPVSRMFFACVCVCGQTEEPWCKHNRTKHNKPACVRLILTQVGW